MKSMQLGTLNTRLIMFASYQFTRTLCNVSRMTGLSFIIVKGNNTKHSEPLCALSTHLLMPTHLLLNIHKLLAIHKVACLDGLHEERFKKFHTVETVIFHSSVQEKQISQSHHTHVNRKGHAVLHGMCEKVIDTHKQ